MNSARELYLKVTSELSGRLRPDPTELSSEERASLHTRFNHLLAAQYSGADQSIRKRIEEEIFGVGPLSSLIGDESITEILLNGPDEIWIERNGKLERHCDAFYSSLSYYNFVQRLSMEAGMEANLENPAANGIWRSFRVHMIVPPITPDFARVTLRRQAVCPWTFEKFAELQWAPMNAIGILKDLVANKETFLIVGGTGSGKTSVLNACLQLLPPNERVITIEDTDEVRLPNAISTKLLTRRAAAGTLSEIDQAELLKQALRMRPDRIIVGEVRGSEAKDLLMAISTGHEGGMGTLHAESAKQALLRLEMLVQLGAPQWPIRAVRELIRIGIRAIVVLGKQNGHRVLQNITRIASLEETGFCLEPVYAFSTANDTRT